MAGAVASDSAGPARRAGPSDAPGSACPSSPPGRSDGARGDPRAASTFRAAAPCRHGGKEVSNHDRNWHPIGERDSLKRMTTLPRAGSLPVADDPVASRIRTLRMSQGLSYKRLSEAAGGLATSFLFNIEHGRKVPGEDVAARIAVALGDGAYEQLYRAWAKVKSRGRNGRADHEALLGAWERLRTG